MTAPGRLYGVGVGPGDPELMTLKAARALAVADVVLVDDLVPGRQPGAGDAVRDHLGIAEDRRSGAESGAGVGDEGRRQGDV